MSDQDRINRFLQTSMSATQSLVSGIPSSLEIVKGQSYTITVTAKDSTGIDVGSGGEAVYLHITDHCTRELKMV